MAETKSRYREGIGRRKEARARVRLTPASKMSVVVNGKEVHEYFPTISMQKMLKEPFDVEGIDGTYTITVHVEGGGVHSQAEAVRLGISRALVEEIPDVRKSLKKEGYLKRDPRSKERRKFGLKKARKSPQWSKR